MKADEAAALAARLLASDDPDVGTMTDQYGDRSEEIDRIGSPAWPLVVGVEGPHVTVGVAGESYVLDAADQERFAQAYVAARHQAKANAAQAATG